MLYLPTFQYNDIVIKYSKRWDNYELCLKSRHFYYHAYFFFIRNTSQAKKVPQNAYFMCFPFLCTRTPRWNVRSNIYVPQLYTNRSEDVTNLSNTILVPIVVQIYGFHGKLENLKKKKLWISTNKKVRKKVVQENLQRNNYDTHSIGTFRTQSNI